MVLKVDGKRLILASASRARHHMLQAAGVAVAVMPATIDEPALRKAMLAADGASSPREIAKRLAEAKALSVSSSHPDALVIGSDQVLDFEGAILSKPKSLDEARAMLERLRGRMHQLHSAVALAEGGRTVWIKTDTAHLRMREYSPEFLDLYLTRGGASVCESVGAYQIEGLGVQLFDDIEGDHFTILGMPLLSLLAELRRRKVVVA